MHNVTSRPETQIHKYSPRYPDRAAVEKVVHRLRHCPIKHPVVHSRIKNIPPDSFNPNFLHLFFFSAGVDSLSNQFNAKGIHTEKH